MLRKLLPIVSLLALASCAGNTPWLNPEQYSGINRGTIEFDQNGKISKVDVWGGKQQESISLAGDLEKGTFNYSATNVLAFDGQKARAAVEQAVSGDVKAAAPGIVDAIMTAIISAINPASSVTALGNLVKPATTP